MDLLNKNSGFVSISFLTIAGCIFSLGLFQLYFIHQLNLNSQIRTNCINSFAEAHTYLNSQVDKLLALNITSTTLKNEQHFLEIKLNAALASGNMALAASIESKIQMIIKKRLELDITQKNIVTESQVYIDMKINTFKMMVQNSYSTYKKQTKDYQQHTVEHIEAFSTRFSVYPTSSDLAPNYKMSEQFTNEQKFRIKWSAHWFAIKKLSDFQRFNFRTKETCEMESAKDENKWQIKIKMDKWS